MSRPAQKDSKPIFTYAHLPSAQGDIVFLPGGRFVSSSIVFLSPLTFFFSWTEREFATCGEDSLVKVWGIEGVLQNENTVSEIDTHTGSAFCVAASSLVCFFFFFSFSSVLLLRL